MPLPAWLAQELQRTHHLPAAHVPAPRPVPGRARQARMRQDFFSFNPTHKLWLLGNHRPEVGTGGFAFWRRMRLIPFERAVADDRRIDNFADILVAEEDPPHPQLAH